MLYEKLKEDSNLALKQNNKIRRLVLADIIASIEKATIQKNSRVEITDNFVNDVLIKYKKTVQEMIDTCPQTAQYADRLTEYKAKLDIVNEYAPKVIDNPEEIEFMIINWINNMDNPFDNKGAYMKYLMAKCKENHIDMKTANKVINEHWNMRGN